MSETELVNSVLYWYVPLLYGVYGLTAIYWKKHHEKKVEQENKSSLFTPEEKQQMVRQTAIRIPAHIQLVGLGFVILTGVIGAVFMMIPLSIFNKKGENYDILVSSVGTLMCMAGLAFFFVAIWPSL